MSTAAKSFPSPSGPRILVTGSQGFFGSAILVRLGTFNCDVVATSRREDDESILVDLTDPVAVREVIERHRPDWVVHAAAAVPQSLEQYGDASAAASNVRMTENVIAARPRRLLFISSMTVYGEPEASPVCEDVALRPATAYADGKVRAEVLAKSSGIAGYAARIPGLYGGNRKAGLVYNLVAALKGCRAPSLPDAPLVWSAMDVDDAAEAVARLLTTSPPDFQPVNIGYSGKVSIDALVGALSAKARCEIGYAIRHPLFAYDLSRYEELTGARAKTFTQAIEDMWSRA